MVKTGHMMRNVGFLICCSRTTVCMKGLKWFRINSLKPTPVKFQFMVLGKKLWNKWKLIINSIVINESDAVELLEITIDNILTFNEHI